MRNATLIGFFLTLQFAAPVRTRAQKRPELPPKPSATVITTGLTKPSARTQSFTLHPTAIAPAGASGSAEVGSNSVSLHVHHLGPGRYVVAAERGSDQLENLGVFTITDPTSSPDRQANENSKTTSAGSESTALTTDVHLSIPPGAGGNLRRLMLLGPGANAVLDSK